MSKLKFAWMNLIFLLSMFCAFVVPYYIMTRYISMSIEGVVYILGAGYLLAAPICIFGYYFAIFKFYVNGMTLETYKASRPSRRILEYSLASYLLIAMLVFAGASVINIIENDTALAVLFLVLGIISLYFLKMMIGRINLLKHNYDSEFSSGKCLPKFAAISLSLFVSLLVALPLAVPFELLFSPMLVALGVPDKPRLLFIFAIYGIVYIGVSKELYKTFKKIKMSDIQMLVDPSDL